MPESGYDVAVFAHNEEAGIRRCVGSIFENSDARLERVVILANGCTDSTVKVSQDLASQYEGLEVCEIEIADKCNAWNIYVHDIARPETAVHFFVDSDVWFVGNVFETLSRQLCANERAHAAAGFPMSGRNRKHYEELITKRHCLFGNCYGLKSSFIDLLRKESFRLPVGLLWIDSAITKVINSDLQDQKVGFNDRIIYLPGCGYAFDSLSFLKLRDIRLYLSRIARYEAGKLQEQFLAEMPFDQWPVSLVDVNERALSRIASGEFKTPWFLRSRVIRKLQRTVG